MNKKNQIKILKQEIADVLAIKQYFWDKYEGGDDWDKHLFEQYLHVSLYKLGLLTDDEDMQGFGEINNYHKNQIKLMKQDKAGYEKAIKKVDEEIHPFRFKQMMATNYVIGVPFAFDEVKKEIEERLKKTQTTAWK
jgi:hypothetical protein